MLHRGKAGWTDSGRVPGCFLVVLLLAFVPLAARANPELGGWNWPQPTNADFFEGTILDATIHRGQIVLVGDFELRAGHVQVQDIVAFDGTHFLDILGFWNQDPGYDPEGWIECVYVKGDDLFFGGRFRRVDGMAVRNLAVQFSPGETLAVGDGLPGVVQAIGEFQGELVVATGLADRSRNPRLLHVWKGGYWGGVDLPAGVDVGMVRSFVDRGTELWVGGTFLADGDTPESARSVAVWDGANWSWPDHGLRGDGDDSFAAEPAGVRGVSQLVAFGGDVYAGGTFHDASRELYGLARWDGAAWQPLPARGYLGGWAVLANGIVPLGKVEVTLGPDSTTTAPCLWDGSGWTLLAATPSETIAQVPFRGLELEGDLHLFGDAADRFSQTGTFLKWGGSDWTSYLNSPSLTGDAFATIVHDGRLIVGGGFGSAGGARSPAVAAWNGVNFEPMSRNLDEADCLQWQTAVNGFTHYDGHLVAYGSFGLHGSSSKNVAFWDGSGWQPLGAGVEGPQDIFYGYRSDGVRSAAVYGGRLVLAGPYLGEAGGIPVEGIGSWDGLAWSAYPPPPPRPVEAPGSTFLPLEVATWRNDLVVAGLFVEGWSTSIPSLLRWDGAQWSSVELETPGFITHLDTWRDDLYYALTDGQQRNSQHVVRHTDAGDTPIVNVSSFDPFTAFVPNPEHLFLVGPGVWRTAGQAATPLDEPGWWTSGAILDGRFYATALAGGPMGPFAWAELSGVVPAVTLELRARYTDGAVRLDWSTSATGVVDELRLERKCDGCLWESAGMLDVDASASTDAVPHDGLWTYRLVALVDGTRIESQPVTLDTRVGGAPTRSFVNSIRPNPFNGATTIEYTTAQRGNVTIEVYALDGRQVNESNQGTQDIGPHTWTWNGQDAQGATVASGVYVLRVEAPDRVLTQRVAYVK